MPHEVSLAIPDKAEAIAPYVSLFGQARMVQVASLASDEEAKRLLIEIRRAKEATLARVSPIVAQAHKLHRSLTTLRNEIEAPFVLAEQTLMQACGAYAAEQRRIARAQEEHLAAEARKREDERRLLEAIEAEDAGDAETAEAILAEPAPEVIVRVAPQVAKVEGLTTRKRWVPAWDSEEPTVETLKYIIERPEYLRCIEWNGAAVGGLCRSQQAAFRMPGVHAVEVESTAVKV